MLRSDATTQIRVIAPPVMASVCHSSRKASSVFPVMVPKSEAAPTPSPYPIRPTTSA
jgi:hypothetical protein